MEWVFQLIPEGNQENKENIVCCISYNSRGFSAIKTNFIKYLISKEVVGDKLPILCNQENFILRDNSYKITNTLPGYQVLINPAVKNSHDKGRPKNGMFIAFPEEIKNNVEDVSPGNWRLQAVLVKFGNVTTLIINSYFPTDQQKPNSDLTELQQTLTHIKDVIQRNDFDGLLWAGDINADFLRNTNHTDMVNDSLEELSLIKSWDKFIIDFTCCHEQLGVCHVSTLDHFFWSESLDENVLDAGVIHAVDNKSDHSPVYCVLEFQNIEQQVQQQSKHQARPSWKRSNHEQKKKFSNEMENSLTSLIAPKSITSCRDLGCSDPAHKEDLDTFTLELLETIQVVAEQNLFFPKVCEKEPNIKKAVPGWKDVVRPFREEAYFWHQVWSSYGRPLNTELHNFMKRTRNKYHYEYKKCEKAEAKIRKNKFLDSCLNGGGDIFQEIKSLRKSKPVVATSMDGVHTNVKDHFKEKYEQLFNSAADGAELMKVQLEADKKVDKDSLKHVELVTPEMIKEAAHKLKSGKSDPVYSFSSDCFKNGTESLFEKLSIIIQGFLIHGHVTIILLLATLVPIIKDKLGSPNVSKNYRSIAISSILLKLIDWVFILLFGVHFGLNDFQFAYQAGCSTTMCTWAVLETVDFFLKNGSEVFSCAMDMTKAFDLTLHSLLFKKMLAAGFPAVFIRLFIFIYVNQMANVRWNGELSSSFPMTNGVRQGAVLSAIAYCFYCENLFALLKQRRSGCWVLGNYHGIFGYSDDNWLLAPSLNALQDMLYTCEEYASSHNLKFSTDINPAKCKTKLMAFLKKPRELPGLLLCGNPLPWVNQLKHLGNSISNNMDGCQLDMRIKNAQYIDKNNSVCQEFFFAYPRTKVQLNTIFNNHFTGSQLWKFGSKEFEKMEATYNRSIKIMHELPFATHRYLIELISGSPHLRRTLVRRYLSFIDKVRNSKKMALRQLLEIAQGDVRMTTGANLRFIMLQAKKNRVADLEAGNVDIEYYPVNEAEEWKIGLVKELIDVKHDDLAIEGMDEELEEIFEYICTS